MGTTLQYRSAAVLLTLIGSLIFSCAAGANDNPPKELVQYVRAAIRAGVEEGKIRAQARDIGWSADMVDWAIAREAEMRRSNRDDKPAPSVVTPNMPPPASSSVPPRAAVAIAGNAGGVPGSAVSLSVPDDYQIGAGDTLQVSVWKELEVSVPSVVVRPDGKITVPLIKDVQVAGLRPREAEAITTGELSKFYAEPNVTVVVAAIGSKKIYIIGSVKKEGTLPYYGMTIMQALSEAGGLTDYAKRKKIYILRNEGGREYRLDFNYDEVIKGQRPEQNVVLLPGDTVVIPH